MSGKNDWINRIIRGDALEVLREMPSRFVHSVITSPPYFGQRDYQSESQLGAEQSPDGYVQRLQAIIKECYRVLRDDGTLWLNLGDKYANGQLMGMPWRVALALMSDGWLLRSDIIWHKPNAMPSSVKNRPTTDHEYVFLFAKNSKYFYDADAIREPHVTFTDRSRMKGGRRHFGKANGTPEEGKNRGNSNLHNARWDQAFHPNGRNRRSVWEIPLSKFREAHFAVFPEKLVELCMKAGSPVSGIVLDPFIGSGTTAAVALKLGRKFVGIDLNEEYCEMAERRIGQIAMF